MKDVFVVIENEAEWIIVIPEGQGTIGVIDYTVPDEYRVLTVEVTPEEDYSVE